MLNEIKFFPALIADDPVCGTPELSSPDAVV
jgi:hypothetical protein